MSGNLFEDRNWLLPKDYLVTENKKEETIVATTKPPLKEEPTTEEQATSQKEEKCSWGPDCPFCKSQKKEGGKPTAAETLTKAKSQKTRYLESD